MSRLDFQHLPNTACTRSYLTISTLHISCNHKTDFLDHFAKRSHSLQNKVNTRQISASALFDLPRASRRGTIILKKVCLSARNVKGRLRISKPVA